VRALTASNMLLDLYLHTRGNKKKEKEEFLIRQAMKTVFVLSGAESH